MFYKFLMHHKYRIITYEYRAKKWISVGENKKFLGRRRTKTKQNNNSESGDSK